MFDLICGIIVIGCGITSIMLFIGTIFDWH